MDKLEYSPSEPPDYFGYDSSGLSHEAIAAAFAASNKRAQPAPIDPTPAAGSAPAPSTAPAPGPVTTAAAAPAAAPDASIAPVAASFAPAATEVLSGPGVDGVVREETVDNTLERGPEQPPEPSSSL